MNGICSSREWASQLICCVTLNALIVNYIRMLFSLSLDSIIFTRSNIFFVLVVFIQISELEVVQLILWMPSKWLQWMLIYVRISFYLGFLFHDKSSKLPLSVMKACFRSGCESRQRASIADFHLPSPVFLTRPRSRLFWHSSVTSGPPHLSSTHLP